MKFAGLNNIDSIRRRQEPSDDNSYPISNGSMAEASCTNGDTENEESTEDKSEMDSSEIDDVSDIFHLFKFFYSCEEDILSTYLEKQLLYNYVIED